ncbi:hypothetical protein FP828_00935 [bacterium]|nr:hypothetical protein [bacterium]
MKTNVMDKTLLILLPSQLYARLKSAAAKNYKSISGFVRESVLEKIEEEFTLEEMSMIEKGSNDFHSGKGTNWRKVKRD